MTKAIPLAIAALLASAASPVSAQGAPPPVAAPAAPSPDAMTNLIRLLVAQGTITRENGEQLLRQAQAQAGQARSASGELSAPAAGAVRVTYVPETVRNQIRDEVKGEIMKQAQTEGWASPGGAAPEWTRRIKLNADIRFRGEQDRFAKDNANDIVDFGAINTTPGGFDFFRNFNNTPILNTRVDRNRLRLRARIGAEFDISPQAMVAVKLATGDDNSPISTNQVLGGGFAKRNIWLDQAYLRLTPGHKVSAMLGRFPNPFLSTDLLFDRDLNFDGALVAVKPFGNEERSLTVRGGAFPLDFGSDNYPSTNSSKQKNRTRWMLGGQVEANATVSGAKVSAGAALYHFTNIQGQLSAPCTFNGTTVGIGANDPTECSSDATRALFPRKGNTLFFIRNIVVPAPDTQPLSNRQYVGLVYKFSLLDLNASVAVPIAGTEAVLSGNYVRNLAFKKSDQCRYGTSQNGVPITNVTGTPIPGTTPQQVNFNPCSTANAATVDSGNQGFLVRLMVGKSKPRQWGEWNFTGDYRYLESDAVLDSFTDSDFHLGGTNTKGYSIGGTLGLFNGTSIGARWMSASEISGRPLGIDVFQVDLIGEF